MSNPVAKEDRAEFGLSWPQRILYLLVPLVLSLVVALIGPVLNTGTWIGTAAFVLLSALLGLITFFISAGWGFKVAFTGRQIRIKDRAREIVVPADKVGMLVNAGGFPFPKLLLVLRNADVGEEIPAKGVDQQALTLIESYQRRNPGKRLTTVALPGGYLRSLSGFAGELKRRIPPVTVDERLLK